MKIVLLGATGKVGAPVRDELLHRGHQVTAVVRDVRKLPAETDSLRHHQGDVFKPDVLASVLPGADVVVCSVALRDPAQGERTPVELMSGVAQAAADAGIRLVTLGGAGSLKVAAGVDLVDTPEFPEVAKPESLGFRAALHWLQDSAPSGLTWTMVSPPVSIEPDEPRTGSYRVLLNDLVVGADGKSRISAADLAVAVADEVEQPRHPGARFAVGY
jgi:putative NADH-flavin reductase